MPALTRQKITFGEMRASGVRGLLIYRSDYKCSHSTTISGRPPSGFRLGHAVKGPPGIPSPATQLNVKFVLRRASSATRQPGSEFRQQSRPERPRKIVPQGATGAAGDPREAGGPAPL
jgi:hypothetical protein